MYESCDVPREEELKKDESEAELKASIDSTTSKHYSSWWLVKSTSWCYERP